MSCQITRLKRRTPLIFALIMCVGGLVACAVNPVTGEKELSLVSAEDEVSMGAQQYVPMQQSQGAAYIVDPNLTPYVRRVGQKIAQLSDRPHLPWEFVVINNDVPNAWALPGGKIAINRGLLVHLEDEAQLAAVLAHEVVHAAARHSASQMSQSVLIGLGGQIIGRAASSSDYGQLASMGVQLGSGLYQAKYSREHELEADQYGITYMSRAGYDPKAAVELQQTFVKLANGREADWVQGLFASHPPSTQRVEANRQHSSTHGGNLRNKAAFDRAMSSVRRDQPAYDAHRTALQSLAKEQADLSQAMASVNRAIKLQPREAQFYVTRARVYNAKQEDRAARKDYQKAADLYPEYFLPWLGLGITEQRMGNHAAAEQALTKSLKILPTQPGVYYLAEAKYAQGDKEGAIPYYKQAAQGGGELGKKASDRLVSLGVQPAGAR